MENLKDLLNKMKEDENSFDIAVAKLKRKAEKGLIQDVTVEDIDNALKDDCVTQVDIECDKENPTAEMMHLIKESQDAVNYYYKEISSLSETIQKIDKLDECKFLDESDSVSFDQDSISDIKSILENLEWDEITELIEYYSYTNCNKKILIEECIESEIINLLDESNCDENINEDMLLESAGDKIKAGFNMFKNAAKGVGANMKADALAPGAAIAGMSSGISGALKGIGTAALAHPLGALAIGGLYIGGAIARRLIKKAIAKRQAKKAEKQARGLAESVAQESSKTIEEFLK